MKPAAGYVLDTNVISETRRRHAHAGVVAFIESVEPETLYICVLTLGELRKGIAMKRRSDPAAADSLSAWAAEIETKFADRVLEIDAATATLWGEFSVGRIVPVVDTLIAATAIRHGFTLVTRNLRDVAVTGVTTLDPWRAK